MADELAGSVATRMPRLKGETAGASHVFAQVPVFRPLRSDAYEALREAILLGRLRPGERIVEAEIARQMGISRGPIREAVRQLEQEELVEYHPRRGVVVARLTHEAVQDTYAVRAELDGFAARLAAARIRRRPSRTPGRSARHDAPAGARGRQRGRCCIPTWSSTATSIPWRGNGVLLRAWTSLGPHAWTLFSGIQVRGYSLSDLAERHLPIVEALRTRDPVTAERTAREHTLEIARNVLDHLDESMLDRAPVPLHDPSVPLVPPITRRPSRGSPSRAAPEQSPAPRGKEDRAMGRPRLIDLTMEIYQGMPTYPSVAKPFVHELENHEQMARSTGAWQYRPHATRPTTA